MEKIPQKVIKAGKDRTSLGGVLHKIGEKDGNDVYMHFFSEEVTIGLPVIYLWDGRSVKVLFGDEADDIISSLLF